jgi:hypothetical protein
MKEIRKQKKKKRNLSRPDRSRPSRPNIRAAQCGRFYPPLSHGQPACVARSVPDFAFIFLIFQNLSPLKYVYLKIYNTYFGSFVSTRS